MSDQTNTAEHDARLAREAALAETARQERTTSAKQKREAKAKQEKPKPAPAKPVAKREGSMAEFVDNLLLAGVKFADLEAQAKAEASRRKVTTLATPGQLNAHIRYRSKQATWSVKQTKDRVQMTAVAKPKAQPAPKKPTA
jgi:hypothetical protein